MPHRANGGYLILDGLKVLSSPFAWDGPKRALRFRQVRIEAPMQAQGHISTLSLEPESDPDFHELFKVAPRACCRSTAPRCAASSSTRRGSWAMRNA